jgi:hypothetical protein
VPRCCADTDTATNRQRTTAIKTFLSIISSPPYTKSRHRKIHTIQEHRMAASGGMPSSRGGSTWAVSDNRLTYITVPLTSFLLSVLYVYNPQHCGAVIIRG